MKKTALITGADGFIGSHLVELLVNEGFSVRAFCIYNSNGSFGWLDKIDSKKKDKIEIVLGDIRDPICVKEYLKNCDYVFHLAALIAIPYSYVAPSSYIDTNIHGTLNVVQAARELSTKRVIHTSTSETYGTAQFVPITEEHPLVGQSPYAASKIGADQIALSYWRSFKTPITVIRPFNTYGPRQSSRAVIPTIITQILSGKKEIALGSIAPTRDFSYVEDTCLAFLKLSQSNSSIGKVVNSASKYEISIKDLVKLIADIMQVNIKVVLEEDRLRPELSEVDRLFGDNTMLKNLTDWEPSYSGRTGLIKGLTKTIDWFSNSKNLENFNSNKHVI
tara:strand:+ start:2681 stop:3682 length:1002 start_codon:yes stop_codon:yes gene_type:complete